MCMGKQETQSASTCFKRQKHSIRKCLCNEMRQDGEAGKATSMPYIVGFSLLFAFAFLLH